MSFMGKNGDSMELHMGIPWGSSEKNSRDAVVWSVFDHQLGSIQVSVSTSSTKWNFLLNVKAW